MNQSKLIKKSVEVVLLPLFLPLACILWLITGLYSLESLGKVLINTGLNFYNPNNYDKLK